MSTEEPKKTTEVQDQSKTQKSEELRVKPQDETDKKLSLNSSRTGLTQEFGKPVSTKKDVSALNEHIESQYQQIKLKKLAQSAISTTLGDLLGAAKAADEADSADIAALDKSTPDKST